MAAVDPAQKDHYMSDFSAGMTAIDNGIVAVIDQECLKYFEHWTTYCKGLRISPYLDRVDKDVTRSAVTSIPL